ncbi:MAG: hypothetical protein E6H78_21255, partial [Betaproteobacteria bacterium]
MEPFAQQPLRQLGIAPARADEVGERTEHRPVAELPLGFQQRLRRGREAHVLAVELAEGVAPGLELRQRGFRLTAGRARAHLLFVERADVPPRVLEGLHRSERGLRAAVDVLCGSLGLARRVMCRGIPILALGGCQRQLLAQLAALAVQCAAFDLERARRLPAPLQPFLELTHRLPLRRQPAPDAVFVAGPRAELSLHGREVALGGRALGGGRRMLAFRLRGAPLGLDALIRRRLAPLPGVAEPLGGEREITLEPPDLEPRVPQPAFDFGAPRFRRMPRLHAGFALVLRILEPGPCGGELLGQLAGAHAERAEREVEVLDLAPHQRHRDAKALLD